jgi:hypothetical protein
VADNFDETNQQRVDDEADGSLAALRHDRIDLRPRRLDRRSRPRRGSPVT